VIPLAARRLITWSPHQRTFAAVHAAGVLALGFAGAALPRARLRAQAVRVGTPAAVARGLDDRPLVEPHLAVHPADPHHLLAAAIVGTAEPAADPEASRRVAARRTCATFLSRDAGRTWDATPVGLGRHHDHQTVAVDHSTPTRRGWLYVVSSQPVHADGGRRRYGVSVVRSWTNGKIFDAPVHLLPSSLVTKAETPAVLPDGSLVVSFVDAQRDAGEWGGGGELERRRGWVARSADGGHTFSRPLFATEACGPPGFSLSALAADTGTASPFRGRLYFACNRRGGGAVAVSRSADGGETWSDPVLVPGLVPGLPSGVAPAPAAPARAAAPADSAWRQVRALAVNAAGALLIAWVDATERMIERAPQGARGGAGGRRTCYDVLVATSLDGGRTFSVPARVTPRPSCPGAAANGDVARAWPAGGDYFGLAAAPGGPFHLLWAGARGGAYQLWTAPVEVIGRVEATPAPPR